MFSHVMVGSNDIERSQRFYDAVLGVLGAGVFRIDAPATITVAGPTGVVNARIDSDGASPKGQVLASFGDLGTTAAGNVGYVERNDGPVNTVPGALSRASSHMVWMESMTTSAASASRSTAWSSTRRSARTSRRSPSPASPAPC